MTEPKRPGRPPIGPTLTVHLPEHLHQALKQAAKRHGVTVPVFVRAALTHATEKATR